MDNKLAAELLQILQHTIGADQFGDFGTYPSRNHFVTSEGSKDIKHCRELVALGLMREHPAKSFCRDCPWFSVTGEGIEAVKMFSPPTPKISRSKARYQRFLEYGECFKNFIEFCRWDADPERSWNKKGAA